MHITVTTTYKTNAKGTGQIVAKGAGRQKTLNYNHEKSISQNHGAAAAALVKMLHMPASQAMAGRAKVDVKNGKVTFTF